MKKPGHLPPRTLIRYLRLVLPFSGLILLSFLLMGLAALFNLLIPLLGRLILDEALPAADLRLLSQLGAGMLGSALLGGTLLNQGIYFSSYTSVQVEKTLKFRYYRHLLRLPFRFFDTARIGELKERIRDARHIENFLRILFMETAQNILRMGIFLGGMFFLHRELGILVSILLPVYILNTVLFSPYYRKKYREIWDSSAALESQEVELIQGIRTVKLHARENRFLHRLQKSALTLYRTMLHSNYIHNTQETLSETTAVAALAAIYLYGSRLILSGSFSMGGLLVAIALLPNILGPLSRIISTQPRLQEALLAIHRFEEVLQQEQESAGSQGTQAFPAAPLQGEVCFENVHFSYVPHRPVLRGIRLDIRAGETLAIVGHSGSGKSTLVHLLPRLYPDYEGCIRLDGVDTRDIPLDRLRQQVSLLPQEPFLFRGTIRENVTLGAGACSEARLQSALRSAGCMDFIPDLPLGLDSTLEEGGRNLSPGQRQRLALARVFLTDPPVLILDEPAASLDARNEEIIQKSLCRLRRGRTTLIIAHRLSSIIGADRIIVLEEGRIVEQGDYTALAARNGAFRRLFSLMGRI